MAKDYHVEHFVCIDCDQMLTGGMFVVKDNGPLCLNCYEIKYASVCDRCSVKIGYDTKDLFFNNRHWHAACFYCDNCKVSLVDKKFATKEERLYCSNCFDENFAIRCAGCSEPFQSGVKKFEYSGMQWHEECFRCFDCKQTIGSKSFVPKDDQTLCVQCYENKYAQRCSKCNEAIRKGGVTYKGEPWHRECFLCTVCNKELANSKFTSRDEKPYCADCYSELFSKHCKKCTKIISGFGGSKFISLEEDHWHTDCFTCSGCDGNLVGKGFVTLNSLILCPPCGKMLANKA